MVAGSCYRCLRCRCLDEGGEGVDGARRRGGDEILALSSVVVVVVDVFLDGGVAV